MKTKEHSTEVRDKVIQMHRLGKGYKIISKCLDIPVSTVGSIIKKWNHPGNAKKRSSLKTQR
ncbi:UNVERIFIED_CONTAM: hypothetical protein FKN15_002548 [Acipenser sinensis]